MDINKKSYSDGQSSEKPASYHGGFRTGRPTSAGSPRKSYRPYGRINSKTTKGFGAERRPLSSGTGVFAAHVAADKTTVPQHSSATKPQLGPSYAQAGHAHRRSSVHSTRRGTGLRSRAGHQHKMDREGRRSRDRGISSAGQEEALVPRAPAVSKNNVRIIPLGGVEEIGRNMTVIEYEDDIVIVDAGFQFPEEETPGIDYIIPNTKYLEENRRKIRGLIISHAHMDHIGAIPYLIEIIGMPTIYTNTLTKAMIMKRQTEFPHLPPLNIEEVKPGQKIKLGSLSARFFEVAHTVPDAIGTIVETPLGNIIYPGDFKIDVDSKGEPMHMEKYEEIGKEKNLVLLMESTNAESPGFSISEKTVHKNLDGIIGNAKGRVITGTFASQQERIIEIVKIAEKHGRKVVIDGRSMKDNIEISRELGYFKPKEHTIISVEEVHKYPPEKILAICTGSQGEKQGSLQRIAGKKHKYIKIQKDDLVILSSSIIPGNERSIQNLKDNLARQGAKIVHYKVADVHASGHAYQEELKLMMKAIKPKFLIPVHGHYFMLKTNADVAESIGIPRENIAIPFNNGALIETDGEKIHMLKETAPANYVMVDGLGVGDVKEVVLRDRQALAQDGIFVVITAVDARTGKIRNSPDIISRGFVYLRESQDLLHQTRQLIRKTIEDAAGQMNPINLNYVKETLRESISKYLFQKTKRRPMVLPVIIEV